MTRALAASAVIAIFAVFVALQAALGTNGNRAEVESLRWDVDYDIHSDIESLQYNVDSLMRDVEDLRYTLDR